MNKRVVVTGLGAVTPLGIGYELFWDNLLAGKSSIARITAFDPEGYSTQIASEIKEFDPAQYMDKKEARRMDRVTQFAVAASKLALDDSKIDLAVEDKTRIGTLVGTGMGGIITLGDNFQKLFDKGHSRVSPLMVPMIIPSMPSGMVSMIFGLQGPCFPIVTACASGTNSIGEAMKIIQRGSADVMVTGGTEAAVTPICIAGFENMKAMSTRNDDPQTASRPFDADRDGFVLGEGAGIVVLESLEHALDRGAHIYCELVGYGTNADAYHITCPAPEGEMAAKCMELALSDANLAITEVDYINAHGTSTPINDRNETQAIKTVFGEHAYKMKVSSNKSMVGHLLGASGGVEFIATALTVMNDIVPPTMNIQNLEPDMNLDYVANKAAKMTVRAALTNSFGFGGHNATLAVKKYNG
ncbi:MAG: beta-ketoacyl-ACP synthase II [Negativicutes bacterium]|jgi:3-oxoacyl-[acyl-carrier-protein] synthase II